MTRVRWFAGCSVLLLVFSFVFSIRFAANYRYFFGMYQDDAVYTVCGKALAEGLGYRIISLPTEPLQTKYPIGYPLFLAGLWKAFPTFPANLVPFTHVQVVVALATGAVSACYLFFTRKVSAMLALVILAASVLNCRYLDVSPMMLSDFGCAILGTLCLWQTERLIRRKFALNDAAGLGLMLSLPSFIRTQGLCVPAACVFALLCKRKFKLALVSAGVCAPLVLSQLWWQLANVSKADKYLSFYTGYLPAPSDGVPSLDKFVALMGESMHWTRIMQNGAAFPYLFKAPMWMNFHPGFMILFNLVSLVLIGLFTLGVLREIRRGSTLGFNNIFATLPIYVFPVILEFRQLVAVMPFMFYMYIQGARLIARWIKKIAPLRRQHYKLICAGAAILFCSYLVVGTISESFERYLRYGQITGERAPKYSPYNSHGDYAEAFAWINTHSEKSDIFVTNADPLFYLYTGHRAIPPWRNDLFRTAAEKIPDDVMLEPMVFACPRFIMDDPMHRYFGQGPGPSAHLVDALGINFPGSVAPVFQSQHGFVRIWQVQPDKLPLKN